MKLNYLLNKKSLFFKKQNYIREKLYNFNEIKYLYIGNNCSELLSKLILQIKLKNNISPNNKMNIYLPGYFCGQSLRFLRAIDIKICFYKLTDELLPDYKHLEEISHTNKVDVFILVHYFGRIKGQEEASVFAKDNKSILIEDCTHIISPNLLKKTYSDFLLFSPYKHFNIPPIGLLFSKEKLGIKSYYKNQNKLWFFKILIKNLVLHKSKTSWQRVISVENQKIINHNVPNIFLQNLTYNYIEKFKDDLLKRKDLTIAISKKLNSINKWKPFIVFSNDDSPYLIPMLCENKEVAKKRFYKLNRFSKFVMQWPDIPFELKNNIENLNQVIKWNSLVLFFIIPKNLKISINLLDDILLDPDF